MPEKTLVAFADHGNFDGLVEVDDTGAEAQVAAVQAAGVDVDALAESLQRQGAKAFSADWAALVDAIGAKVAGM
jgi:transaldolase